MSDPHTVCDGVVSNIGSFGLQIGSFAPKISKFRHSNDRYIGRKISEPDVHCGDGFRRTGVGAGPQEPRMVCFLLIITILRT